MLSRKNAWLSITSTHWHLLPKKQGSRELVEISGVAEPPLPAHGSGPSAEAPWLLVPGLLGPRPSPLGPHFPASLAWTKKKIPVGNHIPIHTSPSLSSSFVTRLKG